MAVTLTFEQRRLILDRTMQQYMHKGWILQSQTDTVGQLLKPCKKRGCLGRFFLGIILLLFPQRDKLLTITVDEHGHVKKQERKAN